MKSNGREKGSSLLEVLISLFVLMVLMIGIIQMFSAAFVINQRSSLRTLEAYKCQQLAENIRMVRLISLRTGNLPPANSQIQFTNGFVFSMPYLEGDVGWDYWGPQGANIVDEQAAKYRLFYRVDQAAGLGVTAVNLTVTAVDASKIMPGQNPYTTGGNMRRVEYVTQMP